MHELCNMVGKEINTSNLLNDCDTFGRVLMHQMPGAAAIIITLGEHGVLLIERLMNNSHIFDSSILNSFKSSHGLLYIWTELPSNFV